MRIVFTRRRHSWITDPGQPIQVIVGGEDKSDEAGDNIASALSTLLSRSAPPDGGPAPAGSPVTRQAAKRDLGVETRKQVVIRE